ncbi:hypothetical protein BO85DRAFT_438667 [Aspergillus piperis CBS 112811]|uniref:Uncharacterized protein n=1 Tax=Aspergillus piperis CBS 112811 TaxID=1448313 RepID=A0A8G1VLG4_9EURO|nr:hypothetical protein BO85DRAFT_438667 [Aspergillus piperis CBS 112811]RAH57561.1 hypothetical protein BO85DRAFT_438667 [Aspergillus piperis CBS 112811]
MMIPSLAPNVLALELMRVPIEQQQSSPLSEDTRKMRLTRGVYAPGRALAPRTIRSNIARVTVGSAIIEDRWAPGTDLDRRPREKRAVLSRLVFLFPTYLGSFGGVVGDVDGLLRHLSGHDMRCYLSARQPRHVRGPGISVGRSYTVNGGDDAIFSLPLPSCPLRSDWSAPNLLSQICLAGIASIGGNQS